LTKGFHPYRKCRANPRQTLGTNCRQGDQSALFGGSFYDTRFALQIAQEGCDSQCVSTQRKSLICRQNIARHVWRLRHTQCFTSLYMASPTATLGRRPLKVGLQLTQVCLPYGASLACTPVHQPCVASIQVSRTPNCQTIKRIAFHRKVTNFGLHATACNSGVPSSWHRSALQNDSHLSPTCQTLPTSQSFGR